MNRSWSVIVYEFNGTRKVIDSYSGVYQEQAAENRLNDVLRRNLHPGTATIITINGKRPRVGAVV